MYKVSVVIPVYNKEKYLKKCLDSVINQTYKNLEIIIINDGSIDNSLTICEEYGFKDERIIIINSINQGVSSARNKGIKYATGTYIAFVDSDDYIESDMIESLVTRQIQSNADLIVCDLFFENQKGEYKKKKHKNIDIMNKDDTLYNVIHPNKIYFGFLWNKLYKREIFIDNNLYLDERINMREDLLLNIDYVKYINFSSYIAEKKYHYVDAGESSLSSHSSDIEKQIRDLETSKRIYIEITKSTQNKKSIQIAYSLYILGYYHIVNLIINDYNCSSKYLDIINKENTNIKKMDILKCLICNKNSIIHRISDFFNFFNFYHKGKNNYER